MQQVPRVTCTREHTISCGHRVHNHESRCANLHGHNYTIQITCQSYLLDQLDSVGRVVDFSVIKSICCEWLENEWDHKFLMWEEDPWYDFLKVNKLATATGLVPIPGLIVVPFNPTAENMACFLVDKFNQRFVDVNVPVECTHIRVIETPKCWADYHAVPRYTGILRK